MMIERNSLETKELLQALGDLADIVPSNYEKNIKKIGAAIGVRVRKSVPLEAPRVLVLHPPFLQPKTLGLLVDRYCLHWVTVEKAFVKASKNKGFAEYVSGHIRQKKNISKET